MLIDIKERRHLRSKAHALRPVVIIGEMGLHESVITEIAAALLHHELIKVRLPAVERSTKQALCQEIAILTQASLIQTVGHIVVLYKPRPPQVKRKSPSKKRAMPVKKRTALRHKHASASRHSSHRRSRN